MQGGYALPSTQGNLWHPYVTAMKGTAARCVAEQKPIEAYRLSQWRAEITVVFTSVLMGRAVAECSSAPAPLFCIHFKGHSRPQGSSSRLLRGWVEVS